MVKIAGMEFEWQEIVDLMKRLRFSDEDSHIILSTLTSIHIATIISSTKKGEFFQPAKIALANPEAERFYGFAPGSNALRGKTRDDLMNILKDWMPNDLYDAFEIDQDRVAQELSEGKVAYARVPILFQTHAFSDFVGKRYIPVIAHTNIKEDGGEVTTYLTVLYLDARIFSDLEYPLFAEEGDMAARK